MVSSVLNYSDFRGLGINSELKLRWIEESQLEFVKNTIENIFGKINNEKKEFLFFDGVACIVEFSLQVEVIFFI